MTQKFIIKHLSSWSPLVQKLLQHVANSTNDSETFPLNSILTICVTYNSRLPKGIYEYDLRHEGSSWLLYEDDELVLHLELIEVYELTPQ